MQRLIIRHEGGSVSARFVVQRVRASGMKAAPTVEVTDPLWLLLGETDLRLGTELAWYLETYLDYPFGPNRERADRVLAALQSWGSEAFRVLFGEGQARDFYRDATRDGHNSLHLVIASDNPSVLAWPWEALHDPLVGDLAHHCRIERQLNRIDDPPPLHENLPRDHIGILLITARPYEGDVAYRSISRPLVDLIERCKTPVSIKLLRPPTLSALRAEFNAHPGAYHIVHFDGHGGFGRRAAADRHDQFGGPQGHLLFENADGRDDPVTGAQLSQLLREYRIPIAVLNACQSAMLGPGAEDAFASVATSLLRSGVRSVIAMGYSLYVGAAREFMPEFYDRLFSSGKVAEAVRVGRQALRAQPERRPGFALQDWLVPVLYQQEPITLDFAETGQVKAMTGADIIPKEARLGAGEAPYGLIGRDSAILALERASRRAPAGLLVHGLGGIGKTTLARGYIEWLKQTQGLPEKVVWMSLTHGHRPDYVLNQLGWEVLGADAMAATDAEKWPALLSHLREHATLIVWDNFESVSGAADDGLDGPKDMEILADHRQRLQQWLESLRGSPTKVLLTSRSDEGWLGATACFRVPLGGLRGEERQALAHHILADQGVVLTIADQAAADLIDSLEGHPLMMRAVLPRLRTESATSLRKAIECYLPHSESEDPVERRLYAMLRYVEDGLPAASRPLLYPIGLHIGYVSAQYLSTMAAVAREPLSSTDVRQVLERFQVAGLMQGIGGTDVFRIHPALTRYLRARLKHFATEEQSAAWNDGFARTMASLADQGAQLKAHDQETVYRAIGASMEHARALLSDKDDWRFFGALTQFLASYFQNSNRPTLAKTYFEELRLHSEAHDQGLLAARSYLGAAGIAHDRCDYDEAQLAYTKALEIFERYNNDDQVAHVYHQLGLLHILKRELPAAECLLGKALALFRKHADVTGESYILHELGTLAQMRHDLKKAQALYLQSLDIKERLKDLSGAAVTYNQLGSSRM